MSLFLDLIQFDKAFAERDDVPASAAERVLLRCTIGDLRRENIAHQLALPGVVDYSDPDIIRPSAALIASRVRWLR